MGDPTAPDSWDGREIDSHWPDYDDVIADGSIATIHFDRDVSGPEDGWQAVRQPW